MAGVNRAFIIGRLGLDPKITTLDNGTKVARMSIATSENYKDKVSGENKEVTEWHQVTAWGKIAEVIEKYVRKGSLVHVEGKLKTDKYTDKDGVDRYNKYILVISLMMLDSREKGAENYQPNNDFGNSKPAQPAFEDDNIPF